MELDRLVDEPGAGLAGCRVELEVRLGEVGARVRDPEQAREVGVGPHRDEVSARVDPRLEHRRLGRADGDFAEDDDVVVVEDRAA